MSVPFLCHWYWSGAVPEATTLKVAVCPAVTVWSAGWVVIAGAAGAAAPDGTDRTTFCCTTFAPVEIDHESVVAPAATVCVLVWLAPFDQWYVTWSGAAGAG